MVREHLVVIFSALLDVEDKDLLQPERHLHEIVPLELSAGLPKGPAGPHLVHVKEIGAVIVKPLRAILSAMHSGGAIE